MTNVSRLTISRNDGEKPCIDCGRPVERTRQGDGQGRKQSRCNWCHARYNRDRRDGMVQVLLTPEEWAGVKRARAAGWPIR
jgi:hypothetical protein